MHTAWFFTPSYTHTNTQTSTPEERYYWIETVGHPRLHRPAQYFAKHSLAVSHHMYVLGWIEHIRVIRNSMSTHMKTEQMAVNIENDTNTMIYGVFDCVRNLPKWKHKSNAKGFSAFIVLSIHLHGVAVFQVPDNAVMALVPKQVTAYNSVNNSTVSRTSASKYGKSSCFCTSSSFFCICNIQLVSKQT